MKRILSLIVLCFALFSWSIPVWATSPTFNSTPIYVASFDSGVQTWTANPGTYKTVYTSETTAGQMSRVIGLIVSSTDTSTAHVFTCQYISSSTAYMQAVTTVAIGAGATSGTPPVNMLSPTIWPGLPVDAQGNPYLSLHNGDLLQCTYATALSVGAIGATAFIENY